MNVQESFCLSVKKVSQFKLVFIVIDDIDIHIDIDDIDIDINVYM